MAKPRKLDKVTIKIHPRYIGVILEALSATQVTVRKSVTDRITRACLVSDLDIASEGVAGPLGALIASDPDNPCWQRWLPDAVIAKCLSTQADQGKDGE